MCHLVSLFPIVYHLFKIPCSCQLLKTLTLKVLSNQLSQKRKHNNLVHNKRRVCMVQVQELRPIVSRRTQAYRWVALCGGLSKESQPVFTRVSEKTTENSERLGRQARPEFERGTSRLPVLSVRTPSLVGPICFDVYI